MTYTLEQFVPLIDSVFIAETQTGPVELVLIEARELARRGLPERFRTPLSLIFEGGAERQLAPGNFHVDHPVLGRSTWMVEPVLHCVDARRAGPTQQYQILFA